ncbi:HupE/UreJ family protein [Echinicola sediminis]
MSNFNLYFGLGFDHILDINGYDHILFIIALACIYQLKDWKLIIALVTSFTIGHSITLALATFQLIQPNSQLIEFLIPLTILFTCISNLFFKANRTFSSNKSLNTFLAGTFGLIHGLGFSNYLRSLLGSEESILVPLFSFNLGLEVGQIIIVVLFLLLSYLIVTQLKLSRRYWIIGISALVALVSLKLINDSVYW